MSGLTTLGINAFPMKNAAQANTYYSFDDATMKSTHSGVLGTNFGWAEVS